MFSSSDVLLLFTLLLFCLKQIQTMCLIIPFPSWRLETIKNPKEMLLKSLKILSTNADFVNEK